MVSNSPTAVIGSEESKECSLNRNQMSSGGKKKQTSTERGTDLSEVPHWAPSNSQSASPHLQLIAFWTELHCYSGQDIWRLCLFLLEVSIDFGKLLAPSNNTMTGAFTVSVNKRCKSLGPVQQHEAKKPVSKIASGDHNRPLLARGGKQFCYFMIRNTILE